jgi:hypothetical protein
MDDGEGLKYFLTDQLSSFAAVLDAIGSLIESQRYLPFGGVRPDGGAITETDFGWNDPLKTKNWEALVSCMVYLCHGLRMRTFRCVTTVKHPASSSPY